MHFFYLDETGCTGNDLANPEQPIFVLGGLSVTDEGWRITTDRVRAVIEDHFGGQPPAGFELHAHELISGDGPFNGVPQEDRNNLAHRLLDVVVERRHAIHFLGIDKARLAAALQGGEHAIIDSGVPYLLGFNYLISYIEDYVRNHLGRSARGMLILDEKENYQDDIDRLTRYRRYEVAQARRLKRLVEFSYPVDSVRHPLIQLSDLVIFLTRKFLECENGYRPNWAPAARNFFASCYAKVSDRVQRATIINVQGPEERAALALVKACHSTHRRNWRQHYQIEA